MSVLKEMLAAREDVSIIGGRFIVTVIMGINHVKRPKSAKVLLILCPQRTNDKRAKCQK